MGQTNRSTEGADPASSWPDSRMHGRLPHAAAREHRWKDHRAHEPSPARGHEGKMSPSRKPAPAWLTLVPSGRPVPIGSW